MKIINEESKEDSISSVSYLFKCFSLFGFIPACGYCLSKIADPTAMFTVASMETWTFPSHAGQQPLWSQPDMNPCQGCRGCLTPTNISLLLALCEQSPTPIPATFQLGQNPTTQGCGTLTLRKVDAFAPKSNNFAKASWKFFPLAARGREGAFPQWDRAFSHSPRTKR